MNTKRTIPISEARRRIFEIADDVQKPDVYYTLTENGRPKVVIMSAEEFESWQETLAVMQEFPDLDKTIAGVEADIKSGAYKNYVTFEELLAEKGYVVADKSKEIYGISRKARTRRTKKPKKNS